jgi:hypothetical protein
MVWLIDGVYCVINYNTKMHQRRAFCKVVTTVFYSGNYLKKIGSFTYSR